MDTWISFLEGLDGPLEPMRFGDSGAEGRGKHLPFLFEVFSTKVFSLAIVVLCLGSDLGKGINPKKNAEKPRVFNNSRL